MKFAADFRRIARQSLRGKWWLSLVAGLVAVLLGGIESQTSLITLQLATELGITVSFAGREIYLDPQLIPIITGAVIVIFLITLFIAIVYFIIGSFVGVGYAQFNLDLVDGKNAEPGTLFSHHSLWATAAISRLLRGLYIFLWSLLFLIPGIVASYSYAMTDYILAENPDFTASEAITRSKEIMKGNRWRLFCLEFSFIGWDILAQLTHGIGNLWLTPYKSAARAAFYRDIITPYEFVV